MVKLNVTKDINNLVDKIGVLNRLVKLVEDPSLKEDNLFDLQKVKDFRKYQFDILTSSLITPEIKKQEFTVIKKTGESFTGTIVGNVKVYGKSLRVTLLHSDGTQTYVTEINK